MDGPTGFREAKEVLNAAHEHIKGGGNSSHLTMKYDGSPAVIFGHHPENGNFFVASKSAFNTTPKINYTSADIHKNHGHAPGLVEKLNSALKHLPKIAPKTGIYQGDLMYSEGDKTEEKGNATGHGGGVSFQPNTIKYTARGEDAEKIKKSKLGIIIHTQYHGNDIPSLKADPHPDVHNFTQHPDVWKKSAVHDTRNVHYSDAHQEEFQHHMDEAKKIHDENKDTMYKNTKTHRSDMIPTYINKTVRTDEVPSVEGLKKHITGIFRKAADKMKTPAGRARKMSISKEHLKHIDTHEDSYGHLFQLHHHLQSAKGVLVSTLNQYQGGLEHHINGQTTTPEGFVVNHEGNPTKLVDRKEFAKANFLRMRSK